MAYKNIEDEREYQRKHYLRNKDLYKKRAIESRKCRIKINKEFIKEYLRNHPCVDCGISDVRVLQFDHVEPRKESGGSTVGSLIGSRGLLEKEIEKCEVRCANCHMIRTAKQFGWERTLDAPMVEWNTRLV